MAQYPTGTRWLDHDYPDPPRLSKLAVTSVICGLLFCVPAVTAVLGLICGAASLAMISTSGGRRYGVITAFIGIVISAVVLTGWGYLGFALWARAPWPGDATLAMMQRIDEGDFQAARTYLTSGTDAELENVRMHNAILDLTGRYGDLQAASFDFTLQATNFAYLGGWHQPTEYAQYGGWPPAPIMLEFEHASIPAAVMIVPDERLDPPVAIDYITVIEPGDFIWTLPSSKGPRGTADFLNGRSWQVVRLAGQRAEDYELALRKAYEAIRCEPTSGHIMNTVGVAEYRVGDYEKALKTLLKSDRMNRGIPEDTAFIALCYYHLGDPHSAERYRQRFLEQIARPRHRANPEATMFHDEVKAVFGE